MTNKLNTLQKLANDWSKALSILINDIHKEQGLEITFEEARRALGIFLYNVAGTIGADYASSFLNGLSKKNSPDVLEEIEKYYQDARIIADNNMNKKIPFDTTLKEFSDYYIKNSALKDTPITRQKLYDLFLAIYGSVTNNKELNLDNVKQLDSFNSNTTIEEVDFQNIIKGEELCEMADKLDRRDEKARTLYQEAYDLGYAPAKEGLELTDPETIGTREAIADLVNKGVRINIDMHSKPIDEEYYKKILGYVRFLIEENKTDKALFYLYKILLDKYDTQSIKYVFQIYKKCINDIDTTRYNESNELKLLDKFKAMRNSSVANEADYLKNTRYKKGLFSNNWTKK